MIVTVTSAPGRDPWVTLEMNWNVYGCDPSAWTVTLNGCGMRSNGPGGVVSSAVATGIAA